MQLNSVALSGAVRPEQPDDRASATLNEMSWFRGDAAEGSGEALHLEEHQAERFRTAATDQCQRRGNVTRPPGWRTAMSTIKPP